MISLRALPILVVLLLSAAVASGQQLTADESVGLALEYNIGLHGTRAVAAEAHAQWSVARSERLPNLDAQASYTRLSNVPSADFTVPGFDTTLTLLPVERDRYHTEVSIEQPLFTGLRVTNQIRAARYRADAADLRLRQAEADVAFRVREAYWRLVQAIETERTVEGSLATIETYVREVRSRVDAGTVLLADLLSVQTRRSEVRLQLVDAANAVAVARLELNRLIGRPLDAPSEPVNDPDDGAPPDGASRQVVEDHPEVAALRAEVDALEAQVRATHGSWLPTVSAVGRYVYARPNPYYYLEQDEFRRSWEAGVALRWRLFGGGRLASTGAAEARLVAARAQLKDLEQQLDIATQRQRLEVRRSVEASAVAGEAVADARESFRVAGRLFEEGVILASQLLDAEQALREAEARRTQAEADRHVARAALLNVSGRVW